MHRIIGPGFCSRLATLLTSLLFATLALAAIVTAAEVAQAIMNSPHASAWLKNNAEDVGNLAMFESSGDTSIYNGSCCYGILQMNKTNIAHYAKVSPEEFRNWPLQKQVDAWSQLTSEALHYGPPQALVAMGTFDGRPVDGHLVLACIQLGVGNCQTMINSGHCGGFRDSNGTSICDMADAIASGGGGTLPDPDPGSGSPGNPITGGGGSPNYGCVGSDCMTMNEAIEAGFARGSGVAMDRLRAVIQAVLAGTTLVVIGSALLGVWRRYAVGGIGHDDLIHYMIKGVVTVGLVLVVMSVL